jgi:CRP-like cAMP-binding protein
MPLSAPSPLGNRLLAALPPEDVTRLLPQLAPVTWALGDVLYEPDRLMAYLYFPTTAVVSLIYTMLDGTTAEMGLVGQDGVVGIALFMGGDTTPNRAIVQLALLRYTQALITQISQTAVFNRLHAIEQRLCRWLLLTRDRVPTDQVQMTQEFLAHMLGVRREGVTVAAQHLQEAGLIRYTRGHITILDRPGLEATTCECYQVVRDEFTRLLG